MRNPLSSDATHKLLLEDAAHLRRMRYFRRQYDQRRLYFYRQYIMQRDQAYFPDNVTPRSNTFVGITHANVEQVVANTSSTFFGFDPWFECRPRYGASDAAAEAMKSVLHDRLHKARSRQHIETLVRNIAIYGHAAIKVDWDWDYETVHYKEPVFAQAPARDPQGNVLRGPDGQPQMVPVPDPRTGMPLMIGARPASKQVPKSCPKLIPIDIYDLLLDPDQDIVGHLTEKSLGDLKREAANNPNLYYDDGLQKLVQKVTQSNPEDPDSVLIRLAELWKGYDKTCTVMTFGDDNDAISWKDARAALRVAGLSSFKRKAWAGESILLWHGENPFMHKRVPILYTNYIKLPNETFGLGVVEIISDLTEGLNRFVNMVSDNWNLGINRRYAFDTGIDIDHEALNNFNTPGGKVGVSGDPNKALFPLPSFVPGPGDYQIIDLYTRILEMTSGMPQVSRGETPGGRPGAGGIATLSSAADPKFDMFIRNVEVDILEPMLEMCASLVMQYMTDQEEAQITGTQPQIRKIPMVGPDEMIGTYEFELVAGAYTTNKLVRQRNMMAFANVVANSPYLNQYEGLLELGKVMEIPHMERLLYNPQHVQAVQEQNERKQLGMLLFQNELRKDVDAAHEFHKAKSDDVTGKVPTDPQTEDKIPGINMRGLAQEIGQMTGLSNPSLEGTQA